MSQSIATKLALYDALVIYLIQSSHAMTSTRNAIAANPAFISQFELLNATLDSAKPLLSKVCIHVVYINILQRLPLPNTAKKRATRVSWKQRRIIA